MKQFNTINEKYIQDIDDEDDDDIVSSSGFENRKRPSTKDFEFYFDLSYAPNRCKNNIINVAETIENIEDFMDSQYAFTNYGVCFFAKCIYNEDGIEYIDVTDEETHVKEKYDYLYTIRVGFDFRKSLSYKLFCRLIYNMTFRIDKCLVDFVRSSNNNLSNSRADILFYRSENDEPLMLTGDAIEIGIKVPIDLVCLKLYERLTGRDGDMFAMSDFNNEMERKNLNLIFSRLNGLTIGDNVITSNNMGYRTDDNEEFTYVALELKCKSNTSVNDIIYDLASVVNKFAGRSLLHNSHFFVVVHPSTNLKFDVIDSYKLEQVQIEDEGGSRQYKSKCFIVERIQCPSDDFRIVFTDSKYGVANNLMDNTDDYEACDFIDYKVKPKSIWL